MDVEANYANMQNRKGQDFKFHNMVKSAVSTQARFLQLLFHKYKNKDKTNKMLLCAHQFSDVNLRQL